MAWRAAGISGSWSLLSWDAVLASVALVALCAALLAAFQAQASGAAFSRSLSQGHFGAVSLADFLLSRCPDKGGLLRCKGGEAYASELDGFAVASFDAERLSLAKRLLSINSSASVRVFDQSSGQDVLSVGKPGGVCVRRLALLGGSDSVLEACVGG